MSVFKNEYTRVKKIDEPLLIIGLGGSGLDALLHIKDLFSQRMEMDVDNQGNKLTHPPKTAYLEIDTDGTALEKSCNETKLESSEFKDLTNTNLPAMLKAPENYLAPYQREWLDPMYVDKFDKGAGGIRQAGRMMLMLKVQEVYDMIKGRITSLVSTQAGGTVGANRITIIVIAGLSGGTGSGTFLDVPYLIRHIMSTTFAAYQYDIDGYLVMPDVHVAVAAQGDDTARRGFESNGFAALKELDYWMDSDSHKHPFKQKYTDNIEVDWSKSHPYNSVTLLSAELAGGAIISNPAEAIYNLLAENMLDYMSYEPNSRGGNNFTYKQHKINVIRKIIMMPKPYPANYCYTAIGAASTLPQQDQMIDYEASLLMDKMVDLSRNQPDLGSKVAEDFAEDMMKLKGAFAEAKRGAKLPEWANEKATRADAQGMRDGDRGYHGMDKGGALYEWERGTAVPQMKAFFFGDPNSDDVLKKDGKLRNIWKDFTIAAKGIIRDHNKGPYYLETLLDGQGGIIAQVESRLAEVRGNKTTSDGDITRHYENAQNALEGCKKGGWVQKGIEILNVDASKYGRYVEQCKTLYEDVLERAYAVQQEAMLETLVKWLRGYLEESLRVYNKTMTALNTALNGADNVTGTQNTIAPFDKLRDSIDDRFNQANGKDDDMLSHMLDLIADQSLTYVGGDEARPADKKRFVKDIEHFVNETFQAMNAANLDALLTEAVGDDQAARVNEVVNKWAPQLNNAASPMFASLAGMANDEVTKFAYVSVPDNADDFKQGIEQYKDNNNLNVTLKQSGVRERVQWLNTYNGLPLCRYAPLERMEKSYEDILKDPASAGIHLIGGQASMAWKELPSPIPHELLNIAFSPRAKEEHDAAIKALSDAVTTGMLKVGRIQKNYDLYFVAVNGREPSVDDFNRMLKTLKTGDDDAANKASIGYWAKKPDAIEALITGNAPIQETVNGDYKKFAVVEGFSESDYTHQDGESDARAAEVNEHIALLIKDLVFYTLANRPYTIRRIRKQLDFFGKLNAYRDECAANRKALEDEANAAKAELAARDQKRESIRNYSENVANMLMFDLIRFKLGKGYIVQDNDYWPDGETLYNPGNEVSQAMRANCRDILLVKFLEDMDMDGNKELLHRLVDSRMNALSDDEASWPDMKAHCEKLKAGWESALRKPWTRDTTIDKDERDWLISVYQTMIDTMDMMITNLGG